MKKIFFILLTACLNYTYGQISISDIYLSYNMNIDQLENFAIKKGYHLYVVNNNKEEQVVTYIKNVKSDSKFLTKVFKNNDVNNVIAISTSDEKDFLSFKEQMNSYGFKLELNEGNAESLKKTYIKDTFEIIIISSAVDNYGENNFQIFFRKKK